MLQLCDVHWRPGSVELLFVLPKGKAQSKAGMRNWRSPVPASPQRSVAAAHFGLGQGMLLVMLLQRAGHPTVHKVEG